MKIWIDGDSCSRESILWLIEYLRDKNIGLFVVKDDTRQIGQIPDNNIITVKKGKDSTDNYIYSNAGESDIVITRDFLFAKNLLNKHIKVLNDAGIIFSNDYLDRRIRESSFSMAIKAGGGGSARIHKGRSVEDHNRFRKSIIQLLS